MPNELYVYALPVDSVVELTLDSGQHLSAHSTHANGRDDAHVLVLPEGTHGQGGRLTVTADGRQGSSVRGIVAPSDNGSPAMFLFDDFGELPLEDDESQPPAPETPHPDSDDPEDIIDTVYHSGDFDLATHDGCGQFTEACCDALRVYHSSMWGHIRKNPGQNQYAGHAVDAVYLLVAMGDTESGVYDIIHDSVSPNASPCFNWKDAGDPNLWYYPTGSKNKNGQPMALTARALGPTVDAR